MKLRLLLFISLTLVSIVPVGLLAYWEQRTALEKEFTSLQEKHLLLARNLTGALERYVQDVELAFSMTTDNLPNASGIKNLDSMLVGLDFRHILVIDAEGVVQKMQCALSCPKGDRFPPEVLKSVETARRQAEASPGKIVFSNITRNPEGQPSIYLLRALDGGLLAIGELSPGYIGKVQKAVTFGDRGHAAIVDKSGRVIAHPLPSWVNTMKDISKLSVIKKMMNGESGVTQFYSPAMKADMVAGFNVVPATGWGVMIPQPYSELVERANSLRIVALGIAAMGTAIAILLSWWLSGLLSRPLRTMAEAAHAFAEGRAMPLVEDTSRFVPHEVSDLSRSFDYMVREIDKKNTEMSALAIEATEANKAKSEFLSSMSHELRTPLNAIIGFAEALDLGINIEDPGKRTETLKNIAAAGRDLNGLIGNILDFAKIEEGMVDLTHEDIVPSDIFKSCLPIIDQMTRDKSIKYKGIKGSGKFIRVDPFRLKQILLNFISNAIKYNKQDGELEFGCYEVPGNRLRVYVSDTGLGIPDHSKDRIFKSFDRLRLEKTDVPGSGIGLSIAKKLTESMGGLIGFESELGVGSTFWVEFPISVPE